RPTQVAPDRAVPQPRGDAFEEVLHQLLRSRNERHGTTSCRVGGPPFPGPDSACISLVSFRRTSQERLAAGESADLADVELTWKQQTSYNPLLKNAPLEE